MQFQYDIFNRTEPNKIYLAKPGHRLIGELNGIEHDSASCIIRLNNTSSLTFIVDKYVNGEESAFYNKIQQHYELKVENIGWFKIVEKPEITYDGNIETTSVTAESLEIELQQYDLFGFKVNCGTVDSVEMMAPDNIYKDEFGYEIPRDRVVFYRDTSEYENGLNDFKKTNQSYSALVEFLKRFPIFESSPRITRGELESTDEIVEVAHSYYVNRKKLSYSQSNTAVSSSYVQGTGNIDCSSFILLCLMGIPYDKSPYAGIPLNIGRYRWAFNPVKYGIRNSATICKWLQDAGCDLGWKVKQNPTYSDFKKIGLRSGDIIFYAKKNDNGQYINPDRYLKISHVAMVRTAVPGEKYTLLECTTTSTIIPNFSLDKRNTDIVAICRPDLTNSATDRYMAAINGVQYKPASTDLVVDISREEGGTYTYLEVLERELQRQQELSLMWNVLHDHGWEINFIDDNVYEDGLKELKNKSGKFDIQSQDVYSFLTQDVAGYFKCIFLFDTENYKINAYRIESIGEDTDIFLSFRNIQNSITINSDRQLYTVFHVSNGEELNIREVNIGSDAIEDLSYYMNDSNFSVELIKKYEYWKEYYDSQREPYAQLCIQYRDQLKVVDDIYYRVPDDAANAEDYESLTDEELATLKSDVEAEIKGYESQYGSENAILSSPDATRYRLLKNIIIKNIEIEIKNRQADSKEDFEDFDDDYRFDFELYGDSYGVKELEVQLEMIKSNRDLLKKQGYNKKGDDGDDYHQKNYENYLKYKDAYTKCKAILNERTTQYETEKEKLNQILKSRNDLVKAVQKTNPSFGFTDGELRLLDKYYIHTDYINENIVTTSQMSSQEIIDTAQELLNEAIEQLYVESHPQWDYATTQDNLFALADLKNWHNQLEVGNFIRVSLNDDEQVKLRLISITFNPYMIEDTIDLEFSSMINYKSKRNDFATLTNSSLSSKKNQIVGTSIKSNDDDDKYIVDASFIRRLINNGMFGGFINGQFGEAIHGSGGIINGFIGDYIEGNTAVFNQIIAEQIDATNINVDKIVGNTGEFKEFFTKYLEADYIVANEANITKLQSSLIETSVLNSDVINVKNLLAGKAGVGELTAINLTSANTVINESVVREMIAAKITVADLKAADVLAQRLDLVTNNGKSAIAFENATQQFYDSNGNVRVQIGQDSTGKFNFIVIGEDGTSAIFNEKGITSNAVADELIVNDMIKKGTIDTSRLNFKVETDEEGNIITNIENVYLGNGKFGVDYTEFKESIKNDVDTINTRTTGVEITGPQVFTEFNGVLSPSTLTITANVKNTSVDKWYIDDVENTTYVSEDKLSFVLPSSYMANKKNITIKCKTKDGQNDYMSVYKVVDGTNSYNVVINSNNGTIFKLDNTNNANQQSIATCDVYFGGEIIQPKSYTWYYIDNNGSKKVLGSGKEISINLSPYIIRKQVWCEVDV